MTPEEYIKLDATALAELIAKGEIKASEAQDMARSRIKKLNPDLNAVIREFPEEPSQSTTSTGVFQGVPFLVKDLLATIKDQKHQFGSRMFNEFIAPETSEEMKRFLETGVVPLGLTNTPEFGLSPTTEPELYGPTKSPWSLEHSSGGSSGGSASAVAARMVPIASASDGGGSIRIPASCCGIFGLKPSRGRTPMGPHRAENWQGLTIGHILSVSVRDSVIMLDATCAPEKGAYHFAPTPKRPFKEALQEPCKPLRIGFSPTPYLPSQIHNDCLEGLEKTVSLLKDLGHECIELTPDIDQKLFARSFMTLVSAETFAEIEYCAHILDKKVDWSHLEHATKFTYYLGSVFSAGELSQSIRFLRSLYKIILDSMDEHKVDVLLTPTLATPPAKIGSLNPKPTEQILQKAIKALSLGKAVKKIGLLDQAAEDIFSYTPYTPLFNVTGQPSASVPAHWNEQQLPIGMMLTTRLFDESTLIGLCAQLENAKPWNQKLPPII